MNNSQTPWRQNQEVHHRGHKSPPPAPILSQLNPLHTLQPISLGSILTPSSHLRFGLSSGLFPSGFPTKALHVSPLSHACHMSRPPHSSSYDLSDDI
jgi:hypothetical protein